VPRGPINGKAILRSNNSYPVPRHPPSNSPDAVQEVGDKCLAAGCEDSIGLSGGPSYFSFGTDTVRVSGPLDLNARSRKEWWRQEKSHEVRGYPDRCYRWATETLVTNAGVPISLERRFVADNEEEATGFIEFNAARIAFPDGTGLCPVELLPRIIEHVVAAASRLMVFACPIADLRVNRLDVAQDIHGVENPSETLTALRAVPRRHGGTRNVLYTSNRTGLAQTLEVGTQDSGHVRLYDKEDEWLTHRTEALHHQRVLVGPQLAPPNEVRRVLRAEVQGRVDWLVRYGDIRNVADLTEDKIRKFADDRLEWACIDFACMPESSLVQSVYRLGLDRRRERNLLDYMTRRSLGLPITASPQSVKAYEGLIRRHKLALAPAKASLGMGRRLDLAAGREVEVAPDWRAAS
jgi:hypothetical protein